MSKNFDMSRKCASIITRKFSNDLTTDQFYIALMDLDREYPMQGHAPPLTKDRILNRKASLIVVDDPSVDIEYMCDIEPDNFREAADIYAFGREKFKEVQQVIPIKQKPIDRKMLAAGEEDEVPL